MMMWGMNTRLSTLFPVMISVSMTRWPNLLTINLVPLHNPIDWLKLCNKRIGTPTLSSSLWFAISPNCKLFRNSTGYNESIETPVTAFASSSVGIKEFALMHIKLEDAPHCFRCRYITTIEIFFDFIGFNHIPFSGIVVLARDLSSYMIMSFIYVLE